MTWEFVWAMAATGGLLMALEHAWRANRRARDRNHMAAALVTLCAVLDQNEGRLPPAQLDDIRAILNSPMGSYWHGALDTIASLMKCLKKPVEIQA